MLLCALAQAADADALRPRDGGEFVMLQETSAGAPWVPSAAVSVGEAWNLVVERDGDDQGRSLLTVADVLGLAASMRIAREVRVGVHGRYYARIVYESETASEIGDAGIWVHLPLFESSRWSLAGFGEVGIPTGPAEFHLGDASGSVRAAVAAGLRWDRWSALANVAFKLTGEESLPGLNWGSRFEYALGLRRAVAGPVGVTVECAGSMPVSGGFQSGSLPLEAMATVGVATSKGWGARIGGGAGLTHGFGSPSMRVVVVGEFQRIEPPDADKDGIHDAEDACVTVPEDRDGLVDDDGCPEDDADGDRFADDVDACPAEAETANDWRDHDGCPDTLSPLRVRVVSADPTRSIEIAQIQVDDLPAHDLLGDDPIEVHLSPEPHRIVASAEGFDTVERTLDGVGSGEMTIELGPTVFGEARVRFVDEAGAAIAGTLRDASGKLVRLPPEGLALRLRVGEHASRAHAPGHLVESFVLTVPNTEQVVTLRASPVRRIGARITVGDTLFFATDSNRLEPDAISALDAIARILHDDSGIQVLRVEGHADETGTSQHNLTLSRTRAAAVVEWLVGAGIARDRLEAIGSGEAALAAGEAGTRTVDFLILSWREP